MFMTRSSKAILVLMAVTGLGACTMNPMVRPTPIVAAPSAIAAPSTGTVGAEAACTTAGRERGLDVMGVVSERDVTGPGGVPERDVMLRVSRGGTQLDVRCNFQPETGVARIMLI